MLDFEFYQNMLTILILFISFFTVFVIGVKHKSDLKITISLFIWHTMFSIVYYLFSKYNVADATLYYSKSLREPFRFYPGTPFILGFSKIFSKGNDANYLNVTLIYNVLGSIGLIAIYRSLKPYLEYLGKRWYLILFIPSMSFWTSGLGKDSIAFFATGLFLYSIAHSKKQNILLPLAFFTMFMVRPHIAAVMLISSVIFFILKAKINPVFKLISLPAIAAGILLSLGFVQQYVGLEESSVDSLNDYVSDRQGRNSQGGSSIDIKSMSYPMQMFTYIFRPLPFDAHSAMALVTSFENTILLLMFLIILFKNKMNLKGFVEEKNAWLLIYAFLTCTILAITTPNLGIATRQKWMFMPILIYLLVYSYYTRKNRFQKLR